MGQIRVILTGISTSNDFRVYYKRDDTGYGPYPITGPSWLNYPNEMDPDGIFPASTSVIRLYETVVTFDNDYVYWIKLEDVNDSKRYLIKNIKIHGDNFCPDIQVTPTVTPTISITPTPSSTPQMTPTPSLSPQASPTPSPTQGVSITPSPMPSPPPPSPSSTPTRALIVVENNAAIPSISNVMVNDGPISSGGFPLTYLGILTGSTSDLGSQNIDIYITYWEGGSNYIKLTDSNNVTYYSSLIGETPGGEITHIIPSIYISLSRPVRLSLEDGTPPSPSVTPSVTRTVTRTPSPSFGASTTPSRTVTPTPTPSPFGPTVIIYNMGTYNINEVTIGTITVSGINFPIVPSTWAMGHTTVYSTNTVVDVMLNQGSIGESVSVNNSCVESQGEGTFTFIGVDTTTGPVTITYAMGSCE